MIPSQLSRIAKVVASTTVLLAAILTGDRQPLLAQSTETRTLSGIVTDVDKKPVAGAVVKLENQGSTTIVSYITDGGGHYIFKRISSGSNYQVWAAFNGVQSKTKSLSSLDSGTDSTIDLQIAPK